MTTVSTRTCKRRSRQSCDRRGKTESEPERAEQLAQLRHVDSNRGIRRAFRQLERRGIEPVDGARNFPESREWVRRDGESGSGRPRDRSNCRQLAHLGGSIRARRGPSFRAPLDLQRRVRARVLGEERRHAPRPRRLNGARVQRIVGIVDGAAERERGKLPLILPSTTFDQSPWMQTRDVPTFSRKA